MAALTDYQLACALVRAAVRAWYGDGPLTTNAHRKVVAVTLCQVVYRTIACAHDLEIDSRDLSEPQLIAIAIAASDDRRGRPFDFGLSWERVVRYAEEIVEALTSDGADADRVASDLDLDVRRPTR